MTNKRHPKGRKVTDAIGRKLGETFALLTSLERDELDAVASDLDGLTEGNCSWLLYRQQDAVKTLVAEAISEKDRARRVNRARMGLDSER